VKPVLLLHHCCGPCSPSVIARFAESYNIISYWFNPNIQPAEENNLRKTAMLDLAAKKGLTMQFGPEYSESLWLDNAKAAETENTSSSEGRPASSLPAGEAGAGKPACRRGRCRFCYYLRMKEAAKAAKKNNAGCFSTTLLSSPHQKHELIRETAMKAAAEEKVSFIYEDFRPFYYEGKKQAKEMGLYMQKYCGCIYSFQESAVSRQLKANRSKTLLKSES
jgi:epoxyqueuosine reductase